MSAADFDRYLDERDVGSEDEPAALAEWLANQTGGVIIGGPMDEPPEFAAKPTEPE